MKKSIFLDPFKEARIDNGITIIEDQDDPVAMVLRLKDVRKCAHNFTSFQSGAIPGRIVIPSEVNIRDTRQIPFELDPPRHTEYRALMEDWFRRPLLPSYFNALLGQMEFIIDEVLIKDNIDVVSEFALPIQSRALTLLLNIPYDESQTWIGWGTHVFRSEESSLDADKANILYDYIDKEIDKAIANPGKDLYSVLLNSEIDGRKLTKEEVKGAMILTFAGGRDTIINYITNTIAYFGEHPEYLDRILKEPGIITRAIEELVRYFSPLTHMGRVATENTQVCEHAVKSDTRISLCWASANRDETVFDNPNYIILDRKKNPHVAFGFSHHKCLGATHARQLMKALLSILSKKVSSIQILNSTDKIEQWGSHQRKVGFEKLDVKFIARDK